MADYVNSWQRIRAALPQVSDFAPVLSPLRDLAEVSTALIEGVSTRKLGHVSARFCSGAFDRDCQEKAIVENARTLWGVRHLLPSADARTVAAEARSGQIYLLTCGIGANTFEDARINQWYTLANAGEIRLEAKSLFRRIMSSLTTHECSRLRAVGPPLERTIPILNRLKCTALGFVEMRKVLWKPSRMSGFEVVQREGGAVWKIGLAFDNVRTPDGLMRICTSRMPEDLHKQWCEDPSSDGPVARAWFTTSSDAGVERLDELAESLVRALAMSNGARPEISRMAYATQTESGLVWHSHDPRPLANLPITGLPHAAQYRHGGALLERAVRTLLNAGNDPKADALKSSLRHIYHAYEGHYLEQHVLSVCLAVEELATAIKVKLDTSLRAGVQSRFQRENGRLPSEDELVGQALLSSSSWLDKIDFLQSVVPRIQLPEAAREPSRIMRNGIVHTGRMLPDTESVLKVLPEVESFWHRAAWAICGVQLHETNVGTFGARDEDDRD